MTDYTPVDCGLHSNYELAIMQHQPVRLSWQDNEASVHTETVLPTDLVTRNGEKVQFKMRVPITFNAG